MGQILQQPISIFEISGYQGYHGEQDTAYRVKEHEKLYQKLAPSDVSQWGRMSQDSVLRTPSITTDASLGPKGSLIKLCLLHDTADPEDLKQKEKNMIMQHW